MATLVGWRRAVAALGLVAFLAGCNEPASRADISTWAMDLLAPVDADSHYRARTELRDARIAALGDEWADCVEGLGVRADLKVASELVTDSLVDGWLPSMQQFRDMGSMAQIHGPEVQAIPGSKVEGVMNCTQNVLDSGESLDGVGTHSAISRIESAREAVGVRYSASVAEVVEQGAWSSSEPCLEANAVPRESSASPSAFLAWAAAQSTAAQQAGQARPWRLDLADLYERCTSEYVAAVTARLESNREQLVEENREVFEDVSLALASLR